MVEFVWFIVLNDVPDLGKMHFEKAQWVAEQPWCALISYSIDGQEEDLGLRLDLDKRAFLDDLDDAGPVTEAEVADRRGKIWDLIVDALDHKTAYWYKPKQ